VREGWKWRYGGEGSRRPSGSRLDAREGCSGWVVQMGLLVTFEREGGGGGGGEEWKGPSGSYLARGRAVVGGMGSPLALAYEGGGQGGGGGSQTTVHSRLDARDGRGVWWVVQTPWLAFGCEEVGRVVVVVVRVQVTLRLAFGAREGRGGQESMWLR